MVEGGEGGWGWGVRGESFSQGDGAAGRCGGARGAFYGTENAGIGSGDGHGSGDAVEGGGGGSIAITK